MQEQNLKNGLTKFLLAEQAEKLLTKEKKDKLFAQIDQLGWPMK